LPGTFGIIDIGWVQTGNIEGTGYDKVTGILDLAITGRER
jgi:hypothetical protein